MQPAFAGLQLGCTVSLKRPHDSCLLARLPALPHSTDLLAAGYSDGDATNFSSFTNPVTVDWSTGSPVPALAPENLNFKIGGPFNYAGDVFRSLGGQVHGVVTYRENHDTATRLDITSWMDWGASAVYDVMAPYLQ